MARHTTGWALLLFVVCYLWPATLGAGLSFACLVAPLLLLVVSSRVQLVGWFGWLNAEMERWRANNGGHQWAS